MNALTLLVARGALVNYLAFFAGKIIAFANTVILARLLLPEHFGLVAVGLLVLAVAETVAEAGIGASIVWRNEPVEDTAPVALAVGLAIAFPVALGLILGAPAIARLFGEADAAGIVRALAVCVLLGVPSSVFGGILQKRMKFARRAFPDVARALAKGAVGIPLALTGFGAWSLVFSHLASVVVGLGLLWWLSGWRPHLSLRRDLVRAILPYGVQIAAVGLVGLAIRKLDIVVIGHSFDAASLGRYSLAFSLVELSVMGVVWSASQALFPALTKASDNGEDMRDGFERGLTLLLAAVLPLGLGLALVADPFVLTVFGAKWAEAAILVKILALYAMVYALGFNLGDIYKATGRPHILTVINLANLALAVPVLIFGARFGVWGVAAGQVVMAAAISAVNWALASRYSGLSPVTLWRALRGALPALAVMALACLGAEHALADRLSQPVLLGALIAISVAAYAAVMAVTFPPLRNRLFRA